MSFHAMCLEHGKVMSLILLGKAVMIIIAFICSIKNLQSDSLKTCDYQGVKHYVCGMSH